MKMKKLKKRLKKLERTVDWHTDAQRSLALKYDTVRHQNENLKEAITKLENDNKYYKEWMDRSGVDYESWFEGENNGN